MRGYFVGSMMLLAACNVRVVDLGDDAAVPEIDAAEPDGGSYPAPDVTTPPVTQDSGPTVLDPSMCPCTRRPGPTRSWKCPVGVDESTTQVVGEAGGTVTLHGQQSAQQNSPDFEIVFQPKALSNDTAITVTETSLAPPIEYHDDSPIYRVDPADLQIPVGVRLTIPHGNTWNEYTTPGYADAGLVRQLIYVSYDEGTTWALLLDSGPNTVTSGGTLTRGGLYFVGFPRRGPELTCP